MAPIKLECQPENYTANNIVVHKHGTHDTKCASIYEGTSNQVVDPSKQQSKVDVIGSRRGKDARLAAGEDPDATECSSSFADTTSGEDSCLGLSDDAEVESQFYGSYDGLGSLFTVRKKKLTNHWRNFILPLMWRCKWTGLKIKEFESQASKYTKKMVEYDQKKHLAYDESVVEEYGSKSLPCSFQNNWKNPLKRRKRKSVEHTTDVQSYMANHHLFSCRESKKFDPCLTSAGDDLLIPEQTYSGTDDFGVNDACPILEINTNSEEQILRKIDLMYSRVHKLKSQIDSIMCKYAGKFSSSESLSHLVPCDGHTDSPHSPTFSICNGHGDHVGGSYSSIQNISDYDCGDFVLPDSCFRDVALIPDIIESTVGRLSSADVTQHYAHTGDSSEKIVDNILIKHEVVEMETQVLKQTTVNETVEKDQDTKIGNEEGTSNPSLPSSDAETMPHAQLNLTSGLTSCINLPKLKRKRGERKAGAGGWCRQQSGEPNG